MSRSLNRLTNSRRPENTKKQMDPKLFEFIQYCHLVYPNDPFPTHITFEKVFPFVFYQAFREQRDPSKRRKKGQPVQFNKEEFDYMQRLFRQNGVATDIDPNDFPLPLKPVGYEAWKQYRVVIKNLFNEQVSLKQQAQGWEHIWQMSCRDIEKHVKCRRALVRRANFEEKFSSDFAPYSVVERYGDIERVLFNKADVSSVRSQVTALRHRYCLLMLTSGILRCESLYRAELSDLFGLIHPKVAKDVHQPYLLIMQIQIGKTNTDGTKLYGRATRHKDVKLCPIGALSFYLMV